MTKELSSKLLHYGELIVVIGSIIYAINLLGVQTKWMLPLLCCIYGVGVALWLVGKISGRKYKENDQKA